MKTLLVIIALIITGFLTSVYTYQHPPSTEVSVLGDETDLMLSVPDVDEILGLYDFSGEHKWNGAIFRFSSITDISFNKTIEVRLEPENKWVSNEPEREKKIKKFQESISQIRLTDSISKEHSSIYFPIVHELERLNKSKSERRILLIYGDLMENTPEVSFYQKKVFQLIQSNPDSIRIILEKENALPSLTGIEIYLLYQPQDIVRDNQFKVTSAFYKKIFEERGATVIISANLSI